METTCIEKWLLRIEMDNNSIILEAQNMENNMKRGPEESSGSARKSTVEKLQLLVKEMQVANNLQILHKFINFIILQGGGEGVCPGDGGQEQEG